MSLNNFKEGGLKEIFDALEETFRATAIDYYLIGAQAFNRSLGATRHRNSPTSA